MKTGCGGVGPGVVKMGAVVCTAGRKVSLGTAGFADADSCFVIAGGANILTEASGFLSSCTLRTGSGVPLGGSKKLGGAKGFAGF